MTKKQNEAVALLLKAIQDYFESEENNPERQERTPVHTIPPRMFAAICKNLGVDASTAYFLATFAMSLTRGMIQEPGSVAAIVGNVDGGAMGGELIVQVEDLSSFLLGAIHEASDNDGSLIETKVGVVNLESGETISEKTVLLNVKE